MILGMAHGWAGLLWAVALWSRATKEPMPAWSLERAEQLVSHCVADKTGGGLSWAWWMGEKDGFAPGWCNGTAGFVLTFCEMAAATGDDRWARLAERAGARLLSIRWGRGHLCCGAAGGAYAAARLHQITGEAPWMRALVRARDGALANAGRHESAASLYKGDMGLLALDDDPSGVAKLVLPGFW